MTARIVLLEEHVAQLRGCLFDRPGIEGAGFLLCGQADGGSAKLVSHAVVPVAAEDYLLREANFLSIQSAALTRVAKLARHERLSIVFAHSHPCGWAGFSAQDDAEEARLLPFFQARVPDRTHGTLVMTDSGFAGRIYAPSRLPARVVAVGRRIEIHGCDDDDGVAPTIFDRQVRAFGPELQRMLSRLHVGVVGLGGTGSPVAEQLCRLGVGHLTLFDGDVFDATNINRVYGATMDDVGVPKVDIAKRHLDRIGLQTTIEAVARPITEEATAAKLSHCDIVFGCTDKQIPRAILMNLALKYGLPVFDLGVLIDSEDQHIRSVHGRITTLLPGEACLYCRGRISTEVMRIEALPPEERAEQIREGYAPELDAPAPAVISFTSSVASFAVSELLHRLTGFMGESRVSSELLIAFDLARLRTNRVAPREDCYCGDRAQWGRGDERPFLGMTWPTHTT
jgi:hypothetical protein